MHEVIDIVVGIEHILTDFFVALLAFFDYADFERKTFAGVIANRYEIEPRSFKRIRIRTASLHIDWSGGLVFLRALVKARIPLNAAKV